MKIIGQLLQQLLPEAIISTYETFDKNRLKELFDWGDVLLIGSGLGGSDLSEKMIYIYVEVCESSVRR